MDVTYPNWRQNSSALPKPDPDHPATLDWQIMKIHKQCLAPQLSSPSFVLCNSTQIQITARNSNAAIAGRGGGLLRAFHSRDILVAMLRKTLLPVILAATSLPLAVQTKSNPVDSMRLYVFNLREHQGHGRDDLRLQRNPSSRSKPAFAKRMMPHHSSAN